MMNTILPSLLRSLVTVVVLVSSYLTLNRFHILFWCFYCWLQTCKYWLTIILSSDLSVNFRIILSINFSNNVLQLLLVILWQRQAHYFTIRKISLYVWVHIKIIPWKICIFNPKNSGVIYTWSLYFS